MIQTEAYFNNIQSTLIGELKTAKRSVYVAVAWFTDTKLFEVLIEKLQENVAVSVVIVQDDINQKSWNDYDRIRQNGGQFFEISDSLMHNKFCIIDERVVITGSYNWTYKAATQNLENIIITYNDYDLSLKFIQQFQLITGQRKNQENQVNHNRIIKRFQVIKNLLLLEEDEMIGSQLAKLKQEGRTEIVPKVETAIKNRHFSNAIDLIDTFITQSSRLTIFEDPMIAALFLEIKDLEYRLLAVDNTIAEKEKILRAYNLEFDAFLGALILEIYYLKNEYHFQNRQESQYSESEYQQAKEEYEEYSEQRETLAEAETHELTEAEQKELKKAYKKAALLCHPDRAAAEFEAVAEETFKTLQAAYQSQNLAAVKEILHNVEKGIFTKGKTEQQQTVEQLQQKVMLFRQKLHQKETQLQDLENNDSYQTAIKTEDWTTYFETLKTDLENEEIFWKSKLAD
jgi:hypothetical protein